MIKRPTQAAHEFVKEVVVSGGKAIDATVGNGYDTCFLAGLVGEGGKVWGFDIQEEALGATRRRIEEHGYEARVELHQRSHAEMAEVVGEEVDAVMFNLGYLPGGNQEIITLAEETLRALEVGAGLLKAGGGLSVVCYPGHEGGDREAEAVVGWAWSLDPQVWEVGVRRQQGREHVPFLVTAKKRR